MKKKIFLIILAGLSCFFIIFKNGTIDPQSALRQMMTTGYAIVTTFLWGTFFIPNFLIACLFFASTLGISLVLGNYLSPTQLIALIALFFYVSRIFKLQKAK